MVVEICLLLVKDVCLEILVVVVNWSITRVRGGINRGVIASKVSGGEKEIVSLGANEAT